MEQYCPPNIDGWTANDELQWLYAKATQMYSIVEVGCWKGRSTHALASGCKGYVFAVDHFRGSPEELESNHKEVSERDIRQIFLSNIGGFRNVVVMTMDSLLAASFFRDKSIDMVYIDGSHSKRDVIADIMAWSRVGKLICGHDRSLPGVKEALEELHLPYVEEAGSIWSIPL